MNYILQYEFFNVGGHNQTMGEFFQECADRVNDTFELVMNGYEVGSAIKTVVRVPDKGCRITKLVHEMNYLRKREERLLFTWHPSYIRRWASTVMRDLLRLRLKRLCKAVAAHAYGSLSCGDNANIAIERINYTFRHAKDNELHELRQACMNAKSYWVFVYQTSDLLATDAPLVVGYNHG